MDVKNSVVVVTGGARGLGLAIAASLASQGAVLALVDVDESTLQSGYESLANTERHSWHTANVADEHAVVNTFKAIVEKHGRIDVVVNNAGILRDGMLIKTDRENPGTVLQKLSLQQWQSVIDVNLTGVFLCGREAASHMIEGGRPGLIINLSSAARAGNIGQSNYAAAKAGVVALTVTWAKELARYKIRAAAIAPGVIGTDMVAAMKPEALERILKFVPAGRVGEAAEIAHSVQYLIENDFFNGRVLELDGGLRL